VSGRVPAKAMVEGRVELLAEAERATAAMPRRHLMLLIHRLADAAEECPRMGCAYCLHQARHEEEHQDQALVPANDE